MQWNGLDLTLKSIAIEYPFAESNTHTHTSSIAANEHNAVTDRTHMRIRQVKHHQGEAAVHLLVTTLQPDQMATLAQSVMLVRQQQEEGDLSCHTQRRRARSEGFPEIQPLGDTLHYAGTSTHALSPSTSQASNRLSSPAQPPTYQQLITTSNCCCCCCYYCSFARRPPPVILPSHKQTRIHPFLSTSAIQGGSLDTQLFVNQ
jgi:hypothetical protein